MNKGCLERCRLKARYILIFTFFLITTRVFLNQLKIEAVQPSNICSELRHTLQPFKLRDHKISSYQKTIQPGIYKTKIQNSSSQFVLKLLKKNPSIPTTEKKSLSLDNNSFETKYQVANIPKSAENSTKIRRAYQINNRHGYQSKSSKQEQGDGRWVEGLKYPIICDYNHISYGCCKDNVRRLHYEFTDYALNQYDVIDSFYLKIRNKNITFLGDSTMQQFYEGLVKTIGIDKRGPYKGIEFLYESKLLWANYTKTTHKENGWMNYLSFYQILPVQPKQVKKVVSKRMIEDFVDDSDIVVFNIGLHYSSSHTRDFITALDSIAQILSQKRHQKPHLKIITREIVPQHFNTSTGRYDPLSKIKECSHTMVYTHAQRNNMLKAIAEEYKFGYLSSGHLQNSRWDLHLKRGDCTHVCFTQELIMPELVML